MNSRQLALLTRQLIASAGGLGESACACRLKKTQLARCQDPGSGQFLPLDALNALELYVGEPLISRALVEDRPAQLSPEDLREEACQTVEASADLLRLVRDALKHPAITPRQAAEIEKDLLALIDRVRMVHAALHDAEARS